MTIQQLTIIRKQGYLLGIKTSRDFILFLTGYYSASCTYNFPDKSIPFFFNELQYFDDIVSKNNIFQKIGCDNSQNSQSKRDLMHLINRYEDIVVNIDKENNNIKYPLFQNALAECNSFKTFLDHIVVFKNEFNISSIYDLFIILLGFSFCGDTPKALNAVFNDFLDQTYINIFSPSNEIEQTIIQDFKVHPVGLWVHMISYLSKIYPATTDLELFMLIVNKIYQNRNS